MRTTIKIVTNFFFQNTALCDACRTMLSQNRCWLKAFLRKDSFSKRATQRQARCITKVKNRKQAAAASESQNTSFKRTSVILRQMMVSYRVFLAVYTLLRILFTD